MYSLLGSLIDTVRVLSIHAVKSNKWVLLLLLNKVTVPAHVFNMDTCNDKGTEISKVSQVHILLPLFLFYFGLILDSKIIFTRYLSDCILYDCDNTYSAVWFPSFPPAW